MHSLFSRRAFLRTSLASLAASRILHGAESAQTTDAADFSGKLTELFGPTQIPGAAAIALRGERIIACGATGVRKKGAPEKITLEDKFHLGSCTKAFTGTLAGIFVDQRKLEWTTTLGEIWSDLKGADPAWKKVTLRHLLAHRGGVPDNPPIETLARLRRSSAPVVEQRRELVQEILAKPPQSEPGAKFVYSNLGFILVGSALERISGVAWEDLMRERIFMPLGIGSGGFGAPGTVDRIDQPRGHRGPDVTPVELDDPKPDNVAALGPAGTAHMTLGDWAKFVALHLRGHPANPKRETRLLSSDTFAQLHLPANGESYVGGWSIDAKPRVKGSRPTDTGAMLRHAGSNNLWVSVVLVAPELDFATLVACNCAGPAVAATCNRAVDELVRAFALRSGGL
jgi:CubicO group peptidase (beta-lactamase class C family)